MKTLLLGIVLIVLVGLGGFFYRNAVEHETPQLTCPVETFVCPDGTRLAPISLTCNFPTCPLPNVTLEDLGLLFALPPHIGEVSRDGSGKVSYEPDFTAPGWSSSERIEIQRYLLTASTTPTSIVQETAIGGTSGLAVDPARFSSVTLGGRTFTVVPIDRFEAVVQVAYYLARPNDVLRFDAIDRGVVDWMEPGLDISILPAQQILRTVLSTMQFTNQ